jgi:hypothetical protein
MKEKKFTNNVMDKEAYRKKKNKFNKKKGGGKKK